MQLTLDRLFASPDLHFFAFEGEHGLFLPMNREAYRRSIFLDPRISAAGPQRFRVPMAPMLARVRDGQHASARPGWIFHVAQCGSTLLARALDGAANLVLREPLPLRQMGVAGSAAADNGWHLPLRLALTMAARRYEPTATTIIKANVPVNFILPAIAASDVGAPAIFLHFALEPYLYAVLRTSGHREWVRRVTGELAGALTSEAGDMAALDDAQRAAALWLAQMRAFDAGLAAMPGSYSLDAQTLLDDPGPAIAAAAALFDRAMDDGERRALLAGELFATYSKNPAVRFDNHERRARQAAAARALAPDVDRARAWLAPRLAARPLPDRLARPLVRSGPMLL